MSEWDIMPADFIAVEQGLSGYVIVSLASQKRIYRFHLFETEAKKLLDQLRELLTTTLRKQAKP